MALGSPRTFSITGSAAAGAVSITVPFFPAALYIENGDATNAFNVNWTTTATATNTGTGADVANFRISAGKAYSINTENPNVSNTFVLSLIAVAGTPAYVINAIAAR